MSLRNTQLGSLVCFMAVATWSAMAEDGLLDTQLDIPFQKFVLDNGLTLIVHEDPKAPIVAVNVWYHVGSKNENPGRTGFAHLFEHLMFNGTENYNDDYFKPLEKVGATDMNGTTNTDRTNYFQNVPTSALDVALWMESDRMGHLLGAIDQAKLDEQRGVVQNEKRQGENQPYGIVRELIPPATYPANHPYSWTVIGSMDDLNAADLEDVQNWFKQYYGAANAVIVIAGDVKADAVKAQVEKYFGHIPSGPPVPRFKDWTEKREGSQRQQVQDRVPQARVYKVWNVPAWGDEDAEYLNLVSDLLGDGKNSRLYKRLVYEDQIATDVAAYIAAREIGSQFYIIATAKPGVELAKVEKALDEELQKVIEQGPEQSELDRIKTQYIARFIRGAERIGGFGGKSDILAMNEVYFGDPAHYKKTLELVRDAQAEDLQRVAKDWLSDGVYALEVHPFPEHTTSEPEVNRSQGVPVAGDPPAARFPDIQRATLSNGLEVVLAERHAVPVVTMDLIVKAGFASDSKSASPGLASLAMSMLDEGTETRDALEISEELAQLGAELWTNASLDTSTVGLSALKANLEPSLDVFADVLLRPAFSQSEFDRLQKETLAQIDQEKASPQTAGLRVLPALVFGKDHPYGVPYTGTGTTEAIKALTTADLEQFHATWFKPNNASLVVVGDVTMDELKPMLEERLGDWQKGDVPSLDIAPVDPKNANEVFLIDRPGAQQSYIFASHVAPKIDPETEAAVETMNRILGGSFTSRVNMNLREDKHWSYGARSSFLNAQAQRLFVATAPVQSDKTAESLAELVKEFEGIVGKIPITAEELQKSQLNQTLRMPGQWETSAAVKSSLRDLVIHQLPEDHYDTYASRIAELKLEDIAQTAGEIVKPENITWVVVGDLAQIEGPVRELEIGDVTVIKDEAAYLQ